MERPVARSKTNDFKSNVACILEASESTRMRMEESLPNYHEDHIAGKGDNSLQHDSITIWYRSDCLTDGHMSFEKCWIGDKAPNIQKVELYFVVTLWKMILDLMQYLQNMDHQHLKWRQQKSWISYPDCRGAQDKQLMQYLLKPRSKLDAPRLLKIPKSECPDIWIRLPRTQWSRDGRPSRSFWAKSVWSSFGRTVMGKAIWENPIEIRLGEGFRLGMPIRTPWKRVVLICVCGWHQLAGKKHNIDPMWKVLNKEVDLGEPTSFLDHVYLGCSQRQCEISKDIVDNYRTMFESRISAGATEKLPCSENLRISSWSYDHGRSCQEMCGTILWVGKQDDSTTLQSINSMHRRPPL